MYKTADWQMITVYRIAIEMINSGLYSSFVVNTVDLAREHEGVYDLMVLWVGQKYNMNERTRIVEDIQKLIDEKAKVLEDIKNRLLEMKRKS